MKIVVVASLTPPATANYLIVALREQGHELLICSDLASPLATHIRKGAFDVSVLCRGSAFVPDLLLFVEGGSMQLFPTGLEHLSCITAWYAIDTHMDFAKHVRIGRLFDASFVAQKQFVENLRLEGLKQVFWLPLAFASELHPAEPLPRSVDVGYVGSDNAAMHPVRHRLLEAIKLEFSRTYLGKASPSQMGSIYAQSKIVFNKSVNNDLNMRYFEAMGAGALLLTDHIQNNGVEDLFVAGRDFVEYEDENSMLAAVRNFLHDDAARQRIADAAQRHVMAHHTYAHRAVSLLSLVQGLHKVEAPVAEDYIAAFSKLRISVGMLQAVRIAFEWKTVGVAQKLLSGFVRLGLTLLIQGVRIFSLVREALQRVR